MEDICKELSNVLENLVQVLDEFKTTFNDYKKPDIRAYQSKLLTLAKLIDKNTQIKAEKLNQDIDLYLSKPIDEKINFIIKDALYLQKDLFEL
jgi:hypothetical protein